jgi:tRNA (cytidine32/uridine32-2'-O)-methyltransferase
MLKKIRTLLLHNSHPGNIGASARALKNMGLSQLSLLSPKEFPSAEAEARASSAQDILANTRVFSSLEEALNGCTWVLGCSARQRKLSLPIFSPQEAAIKIKQHLTENKVLGEVAILYGNEKHGLSNEELSSCAAQILIPTASDYASLNLAQAVQIISYELFLAFSSNEKTMNAVQLMDENAEQAANEINLNLEPSLPSYETLAEFYRELEKTLIDIQFLDPKKPGQMMVRLKRLFAKAEIDKTELTLLRGMLSAIRKRS